MEISRELKRFTWKFLIGALIVITLLLLWRIADIVLLFFLAILLSLVIHIPAQFVKETSSLGYRASVLLSLVFLVAVIALSGFLIAAPIVSQLQGIVEGLPSGVEEVREAIFQYIPDEWADGVSFSWQQVLQSGGQLASEIVRTLSSVFTTMVTLLLVLIASVYLAFNPSSYRRGLFNLLPERAHGKTDTILNRLKTTLSHWLLGQFIIMIIVGAITTVGLYLLGVPFALGLGFLAGILEFVPIIGSILAGVPAILLAFSVSPTLALYTLIFFVLLQQIEGNILVPLIYQESVDLPPVLTLFAVLVMGAVFGILGLLLAAPFLIVVKICIEELYQKPVLDKKKQEA